MSPSKVYALLRRHLVAVTVVLAIAAGSAWDIKSNPPVYQESAEVIFAVPGPNPYSTLNSELVPAANLMTRTMQGAGYEQQVRQAGGTAEFNIGLVNLYNEQFPYYDDPYVTVTAQSPGPEDASRTFQIAVRVFRNLVTVRQAQAGVQRQDFITTHIVADSGPVAQLGSMKRALAGLVVLTIMVLFLVVNFLDRRPSPGSARHSARSVAAGTAAGEGRLINPT
jgi:hypothetical protein